MEYCPVKRDYSVQPGRTIQPSPGLGQGGGAGVEIIDLLTLSLSGPREADSGDRSSGFNLLEM